MKLPEEIELNILNALGLSDLYTNPIIYQNKIEILRRQLINLSQGFIKNQPVASKFPDAYFCFNFPQNFVKSIIIMKKLFSLYKILPSSEYKILDIGCGEGAGMFGLYYYLSKQIPGCKFFLKGVDINHTIIKRCELTAGWFKQTDYNFVIQVINEPAIKFINSDTEYYNFIVLANSITEIFPNEQIPLSFIQSLMSLLKENGIIIIMEPALKTQTRRLMELRNVLIRKKNCVILLPCLHNNDCPALKRKKEWCHQSIKWIPPEYLKIINQKLFRKIEYLKFSYLIIANKEYETISGFYPVISRLAIEKGRLRCLICTADGIIDLIRFNKEKSMKNQDFERISMGDIIGIDDIIKSREGIWKVSKNSVIKRLDF